MFLKLVTIVSLFIISVNSEEGYFRDYYWRVYRDSVPSDAVEGGKNINGTTYIGQVLDIELSPVEIRPGFRQVYIPVETPIARDHYISILCSDHPSKLRWYSTSSNEFQDLVKEKTVVRGGADFLSIPYYIGRVFFNNQSIIGRVVPTGVNFAESLYWSAGGYYYHQSKTFDVLVYEDPFDVEDRRT